ncbi:hypothetical protein K402DRAFT_458448 [Aulographum hederae CBS 113979]|uniref:Rho-GAP domain-containing protein n=1 Tax=Aulographum hederae CBS 113979 TaxID=1176131 RepID=A0A6G1GJ93_9PEZI|nr:hypothetical protein K402DRAFT_458448 [Aulographum hederae CBS 113979]
MSSFANSFWSGDYAGGLGVLFGKLQQGVQENQQVLTIAKLRAEAEDIYGQKLGDIGPATDRLTGGFQRDDGASVRKTAPTIPPTFSPTDFLSHTSSSTLHPTHTDFSQAYEGVRSEMEEAAKNHRKIASNIRELVVNPFGRWCDAHAQRVQSSQDALQTQVKNHDRQAESVRKFRSAYYNKCRQVEDLEEEDKLAFQDPKTVTPSSPKPKPIIPVPTINEPDEDDEPLEIGDEVYEPEAVKKILTNMLATIKIGEHKVPILGTYQNVSTGADITDFIQKSMGASSVSYAERIGQDMVAHGFLRMIGNMGSTFANSSRMNYQWRPKVFKITGIPEKKKPLERVSTTDSRDSMDSPSGAVGEYLAGWNPLNNPYPNESPAEKLRREAKQADETYKAAIKRLDAIRCTLEEEMVMHLKFMERCELDRLKAIKAVIIDFSGAISNVMPSLQSQVDNMMLFQETVQPLGDLRYLLENYRTGQFVPKVVTYENYYNSVDGKHCGTLHSQYFHTQYFHTQHFHTQHFHTQHFHTQHSFSTCSTPLSQHFSSAPTSHPYFTRSTLRQTARLLHVAVVFFAQLDAIHCTRLPALVLTRGSTFFHEYKQHSLSYRALPQQHSPSSTPPAHSSSTLLQHTPPTHSSSTIPLAPLQHHPSTPADSPPEQTYGVDLEARARSDRKRVPIIVTTILTFLDNHYPDLEGDSARRGIWLVDVPLAATHRLRALINTGKPIDHDVLDKFEIPIVASALKLYLLELPDSIVSSHVYEIIKTIYSTTAPSTDLQTRLSVIQSTLGQLRLANIATLDALATHFTRLIELTSADEEYVAALANALAPCILRPKTESSITMTEKWNYRLLRDLFAHKEAIFGELKRASTIHAMQTQLSGAPTPGSPAVGGSHRPRAISTDESNRRANMEERQRAIASRTRAPSPGPGGPRSATHKRDRSVGRPETRFPISTPGSAATSPTERRATISRHSLEVPGSAEGSPTVETVLSQAGSGAQQQANGHSSSNNLSNNTSSGNNASSNNATQQQNTSSTSFYGAAPAERPSLPGAASTEPASTDSPVEKRDSLGRSSKFARKPAAGQSLNRMSFVRGRDGADVGTMDPMPSGTPTEERRGVELVDKAMDD